MLQAELVLRRDDAYRVQLADADGLRARDGTAYFIRLMEDRPPDVRIVRPAGDQGITPLQEIAIDARAEDDYGALKRDMAKALAPWRDRALWVEYERARNAPDGPLELRVHRVVDGRLRHRVLATGGPRPVELSVHEIWGVLGEGESVMR